MKKNILIFSLMTASILAMTGFAACDKDKNKGDNSSEISSGVESEYSQEVESSTPDTSTPESSSDAPVVTNTAVTYVLTNADGEELTYTATQTSGSALTYTVTEIDYHDVWYTDKTYTTEVSVASGDTMTVYTEFSDIYIDCIFRSGGKTINAETIALRGASVTLPEPNEIDGHEFLGWLWNGEKYNVGDNVAITSLPADYMITFVADWKADEFEVTYVYHTGETKTVTQTYGSAVEEVAARTGYNFLGWFAEGIEEPITVLTAQTELEEKWEAYSYAVTFELGGYEGAGEYENGDYDYDTKIALPQLDKKGYAFLGWYISVDGAESAKTMLDEYTVGSDIDATTIAFEAKFEAKTRTFTVYLEDGATAEVSLKTGENLADVLKAHETDGFSGWFYDQAYTKGVGSSDLLPAYGDNETFSIYGSYYQRYDITFVVDGVSSAPQECLFGAAISDVKADPAEKTGYDFLGWYNKEEGGEKITTVPAGGGTLYARYELKTFDIVYDVAGGNGTVAGGQEKYGTEITLATGEGLTKKCFVFGGWTDGENVYAAGETLMLTSSLNLTAIWNSYDVVLNLTDWDGTTIVSGTFDSGKPFALPEGSVWEDIIEFEGFVHEDLYGNVYYLHEGDLLEKDVTATAYYVNRRTGKTLNFPSVDSFAFFERANGTYWISGRDGVYHADGEWLDADTFFVAEAFPKDMHFPATYKGSSIYGFVKTMIDTGYTYQSRGAFSIYAADNYGYDSAPYKITGEMYIPSCYQVISENALHSQCATVVEFGQDSQMRVWGKYADVVQDAQVLYGFPKNLKYVYQSALGASSHQYKFYYDDGTEVTKFPTSITYVGSSAFQYVDIFTEVDLTNVTYCGGTAFGYCNKIEKVMLGRWEEVPSRLFYFCKGLTSVTIPNSITRIADGAFQSSGIKEVIFEDNSQLETIGFIAFNDTPLERFEMPDSVTTVGSSAFTWVGEYDQDNGSELRHLTLSKSLKTVGQYAFAGVACGELELPEGLEEVGDYAFYGIQNWKKVQIPSTLKTIGEKAFMKTAGYTFEEEDKYVLKIGAGTEFIDECAFRNIQNIVGIEFTENGALRELANYVFSDLPNLAGASIVFPEGLVEIGTQLFAYMKDSEYTIPLDESAPVKSVHIPSTVTFVGGYAFAYNNQLDTITFADNQTEGFELILGFAIVAHCPQLKSVELPCQLMRLAGGTILSPSGTFWNCPNLEEVYFRGRANGNDGALEISSVTFVGCTGLKKITMDRNTAATIIFPTAGDRFCYDVSATDTIFMEDCSKVMLWVREDYQGYYNDATNSWGSRQPTKIYRVRVIK